MNMRYRVLTLRSLMFLQLTNIHKNSVPISRWTQSVSVIKISQLIVTT